jgi:hypothetical protein
LVDLLQQTKFQIKPDNCTNNTKKRTIPKPDKIITPGATALGQMSVYVMCSIVGFYLSYRNYDGWPMA